MLHVNTAILRGLTSPCTHILIENYHYLGVCLTLVYETKGAPSECQQHWLGYGGRDLQ